MIEAFHTMIASPLTTEEDAGYVGTTYMAYLVDTRGLSREAARDAVDADRRAWREEAKRSISTPRLMWNDFKDASPYLVVTLVVLGIYVVIEFLAVVFVWSLRHVVDPVPAWLWLAVIVATPVLTWLVMRVRKYGGGPFLTLMFSPPLIAAVAVLLGA